MIAFILGTAITYVVGYLVVNHSKIGFSLHGANKPLERKLNYTLIAFSPLWVITYLLANVGSVIEDLSKGYIKLISMFVFSLYKQELTNSHDDINKHMKKKLMKTLEEMGIDLNEVESVQEQPDGTFIAVVNENKSEDKDDVTTH